MTQTHALHQLVPLAAQELDDNKVTPGLLGFVIFAVIALALWALMKNMGKQMKKIDFEEPPGPAAKPRAGLAAHRAAVAAAAQAPADPVAEPSDRPAAE
ncbi:hypothetical protein V2S66_16455 [Streptomyces sp. V4-01]|uniref:Uncharacterized protein n=1 Tax=Actinacidiphila polyblastidii TaxID=3110430 RepID=A0ABU7PCM8_9ACTN|nr:hypothetical protein [Streptomyces sp. V4-01]